VVGGVSAVSRLDRYLDAVPDWQSIFDPNLSFAEAFVRGTVTFLAMVVLMRVGGQRESGGLSLTDGLFVVLVAEAVAAGLHGDAKSVTEGIVLVATIVFWCVLVDAIGYRYPRLGVVVKRSRGR